MVAEPTRPRPQLAAIAPRPEADGFEHDGTSFGRMLARLRRAAGLSQNQLARRAAVDPAYVNRLEATRPAAGARAPTVPSRAVVLRLWEALETSTDERERLLVAAGYCPEAILQAGGWDAYVGRLKRCLAVALGEVEDGPDDLSCVRRSP